jgi:hypothetical protein
VKDRRLWRWLCLCLAGPLAGCETPPDGVLSVAFLLETPPALETRQVPPEAATGVPPLTWAAARGRCDCDVPTRQARCTFEGLPATTATGQPLSYELTFLIWYAPLTARFDGRALDRDPGGRDPDLPPPPMVAPVPRAVVGPVSPDPFGKAERTLTNTDLPLDRVAGGELKLIVQPATGPATPSVIIDGRVGNLPSADPVPTTTPAPTPGGHMH